MRLLIAFQVFCAVSCFGLGLISNTPPLLSALLFTAAGLNAALATWNIIDHVTEKAQ